MKHTEKLILGCFLMSGLTALVYEVIWVRMMVLVFGATTLATSTVLTAYMGGLAIGSFFFGRHRPQRSHPLLLYAALEIGIGCYALLIPWILSSVIPLYQKVWAGFELNFYAFSLFRFVLVSLVLLLPTTLMGATLPVLSRTFERYSGEAGRKIGLLYAFNTFGAVVGSFSTGFLLLPAMGVQHSTQIAAGLNFLVGVVAVAIWRSIKEHSLNEKVHVAGIVHQHLQPKVQNPLVEPILSSPVPRKVAIVIMVSLMLSGFAAMVYEVAWSRALSLVMGSTLYAFSAMLTTFLTGLALGSFLCALRVERLRSRIQLFGLVQVGIGGSAFLTLSLMGELPYLFIEFYHRITPIPFLTPLIWFSIAFVVMLLPTLLLGTLFPLAVKILHSRLPVFDRLAGDVYAVNTLGAILGAFFGGFVFIPQFGIQGSVLSMVYLNLILGLLIILIDLQTGQGSISRKHRLLKWSLAGGIILIGGGLMGLKPSWNSMIMSAGVFLQPSQHASLLGRADRKKFYQELEKDRELLFYKEGITATITVERHQAQGMRMRVNGRSEAGEHLMRTQALIGHIPMMMAQRPDDILVIGFGSGATVGSVALYPVNSIKVVELEPAVIEASRFFEPSNHRPLDDSRVNVQINDGRNFLLATDQKFDVIIAQPSLPWITGASNLFTTEFFKLGSMHLKAGGIFGQWISGDTVSLENFKSLVKAFHEAFPSTWLFETVTGDSLLVGSREPLALKPDKLEAIFRQESIRQDLLRVGVEDPYDLLILYRLGETELDEFIAGAASNTDDNALVELTGPVHYYSSDSRTSYGKIQNEIYTRAVKGASEGRTRFWIDQGIPPEPFLLKMGQAGLKNKLGPWSLLYADLSLRYQETAEGHHLRGRILASLVNQMDSSGQGENPEREKILQEVVQEYQKALWINPDLEDSISLRYELGAYYFSRGQLELAEQQYQAILKRVGVSYEASMNLGRVYLLQGRLKDALVAYQKASRINPQTPEPLFKLGLINSSLGQYRQAIHSYEKVLEMAPGHLEAHYNLARVYELIFQNSKAIAHYEKFLALTPSDSSYGPYRAIAQGQMGKIRSQ